MSDELKVYREDGSAVPLGERLGEGGQGKVYFLQGDSERLAKIYKAQEDLSTKLPRLRALLAKDCENLRRAAAWPHEPLMDESGQTVGFLMENLKGWVPLHKVYQIKSRLTLMPNADFGFLVRVARNLATCVHFMHESGIVVGDMNETNAFVSGNAMVKLIDSDSVQVEGEGELFTCDVGRPELIAPELQGRSLTGKRRTPEEDRFALAVLVFQTLTFGRHPFAGRPKGSEEILLETAIEHKLYVYHTQGNSRLLPPPGLELRFLNPEIRGLFDRAFAGLPEERPTAREWYDALERFEKALATCEATDSHCYEDLGQGCPWCRLEEEWRVALFGGQRTIERKAPDHDLEKIWNQIEGVPEPSTYEIPEPFRLEKVEPVNIRRAWMFNMTTWIILVSIFVQLGIQWGAYADGQRRWELIVPLWIVCLVGIGVIATYGGRQTKKARAKYEEALAKYNELLDEWDHHAGLERFVETKQELNSARLRLSGLDGYREQKLETELKNVYGYELQNYLRKYSVLVADIGASSKALLSRLHDNGIQTAADLQESELAGKHNISEQIVRDLMGWKASLEAAFWSTSPYQLSRAHADKIDKELAAEAEAIRRRLRRGTEELEVLSRDMLAHQRYLGPQIFQVHHDLTEAAKVYRAWLGATGKPVPIRD